MRVVVLPVQHLGAAQRVFDRLLEQPRQRQREELVAEQVQEAHRLAFHRIDQAHAVDELALARDQRAIELGQILGRDGQIRVEDHQHVVAAPRRSPCEPRRPCPCLRPAAPGATSAARGTRASPLRSLRPCRHSSCRRRRSTRWPGPSAACAPRPRGCCRARCDTDRSRSRPASSSALLVPRRGRRSNRPAPALSPPATWRARDWRSPRAGMRRGHEHVGAAAKHFVARQVQQVLDVGHRQPVLIGPRGLLPSCSASLSTGSQTKL